MPQILAGRQAGNCICICIRNKVPEHKIAVQGAEWTLDQVLDESNVPIPRARGWMRGVVLYFIFDFENYRFVRLASVACYQAVDWQVGSDEIQGVVLYMHSCPVLLETA